MRCVWVACSLTLMAASAAGCASAGAARALATASDVAPALSSTPAPSALPSPTATAIAPTAAIIPARPTAPASAWIDEAAFRGEGVLAFARNGQLFILDGINRTLRIVAPTAADGEAARVSSPRWSPDGEWLAYLRTVNPLPFDPRGELWIVRRDGSVAHAVAGLPGPVGPDGFAWSPTADRLAAGSWIVAPSGAAQPIAGINGVVNSFAWSPDGRHLAFIRAAALPDPARYTAAWSATHALWTANADGSDPRELIGAGAGAAAPRWSYDGSQILYVRQGRLWRIDPAGGLPAWIVDLRAGGQDPLASSDHGWVDWSLAFAWHQ